MMAKESPTVREKDNSRGISLTALRQDFFEDLLVSDVVTPVELQSSRVSKGNHLKTMTEFIPPFRKREELLTDIDKAC